MFKNGSGWLLMGLFSLILFCPETGTASIGNIKEFMETCPKNDPIYSKIKSDFTIRRNGVIVQFDDISCSEPTSSMNIAQYSNELIVLQGLRVMYYMDLGQSGHLPWTSGTLYQWMKSKIKGFNIDDTLPPTIGGQCCASFPDGLYITVPNSNDDNRDFDRTWQGIGGNIGLYAHEVRHLDGPNHSCEWDPILGVFAQDWDYNPAVMSSFGTQWWLEKSWLNGDINVGYSCLSPPERQEIADWHSSSANLVFRNSFCNIKPPLVPAPANPGGLCQDAPTHSWKVQTVDAALDFGRYVSTVIDPGTDIPYISYFDATNGHLRLASQVTSGGNCGPNDSWWCRTMDDNPQVGKYSSIDIFKSGAIWRLGISYIDETNHALKYYQYSCFATLCSWASETIDASLNPTRFTSLKFDTNGAPHIAYHGICGANCSELKYASYVGSGGNCGAGKWSCTTVKNVAHAQYGLYPSLALNGSNQPRIAHYDAYFGNLGYAWDCGSGSCGNCGPSNRWQCDVMDSTGNVGLFPSLHVDKGASDNAHIAYYDSTNGKLKYITAPGTIGNCGPLFFGVRIWQCDVIADMGAGLAGYVGVSLDVDPTGKPLIAYMDASDAQAPAILKVAQPTSLPGNGNCGPIGDWECTTVDGGGSWTEEGRFVSLAFNPKGEPFLAYYEEDNYYNGNLKMAFRDTGYAIAPTALYFPHVDTSIPWQIEIAIINTGNQTVTGIMKGISNTGVLVETRPVTLSPHGRRQATVAEMFTDHANIGYIIFDTDSAAVQGYTKFYQAGKYRAAIPAVKEVNASDIYISHIDSGAQWWTGVSLVNTTSTTKNMTITFNNGVSVPCTLNANEHKVFTIGSLLNQPLQPGIQSAVITNASGVIGLELFGNIGGGDHLDGLLLTDKTASTLYYPHVDNNGWQTGIVAYNPSVSECTITITPYSALGTAFPPTTHSIAGKGKYVGLVTDLGLPVQTAWFKIDSTSPLSGFELFSTVNGNQLAAYAGGGGAGAKTGVFPKIEKNGGWTGIVFVNTESTVASVTLTAYRDNGTEAATQVHPVGGHAKMINYAEDIFSQDISSATYIAYSSDKKVVGFQLNGSSDGTMLDGLPGLAGTN